MKLKNQNKAFTLMELLAWIAIIAIIILWTTNIDYNRLTSKQKIEIFSNKIITTFESIRNSTLTWKSISANFEVPEKMRIEYSNAWSWTITISSYDWTSWSNYDTNNDILFGQGYTIWNMRCLKLDLNVDSTITWWTWTIEFEWINMTLTWACSGDAKILEMEINYSAFTKILQINTLNWLVNKELKNN